MHRAPLVEVFASIQGEGAYVGQPQTFLRLAGCPFRCRYCDSEPTWEAEEYWRLALPDGDRRERNPVTVTQAIEAIEEVERAAGLTPQTVSVTGGEPLVHAEFLEELCPALRAQGRRVHLETAGVHFSALEPLLAHLDHVSADLKLDSTMETGSFGEAHRRFYELCADRAADWCVKCVLTPRVSPAELDTALATLQALAPGVALFLQPVTPMRLEQEGMTAAALAALTELARRRFPGVRMIPQTHRALGLR